MGKVRLQIDGQEVEAEAGTTVLEAARQAGVGIPSLCHHPRLKPYGACRLCLVEARQGGRSRLVVSCVYEVAEGLEVTTRSEKIARLRRAILELLLARAPHSPQLQQLARVYKANARRFPPESSFCVQCGLCVRYCAEVKQLHVVGFTGRGTRKEIAFVPELAARECASCQECFPLCPTSYLQAAYVLATSLSGGRRQESR